MEVKKLKELNKFKKSWFYKCLDRCKGCFSIPDLVIEDDKFGFYCRRCNNKSELFDKLFLAVCNWNILQRGKDDNNV